jgi:Signal transduction histidine kinase regulating C4-dicarboxylate transport system
MKPLRARSIRTRLLFLVLAAVLPAMAIVSYSGFELRDNVVREAEQYALRQVQAMAAHHERVVDNARLLLLTLARASEIRSMDGAACQVLLADVLKRNPTYQSLQLAAADGRVVAAAPLSGPAETDQLSFQDALRSGAFATGKYTLDPGTRHVVIRFAQPVADTLGRSVAVLTASFDLNVFGRLFRDLHLPEGCIFTLTSADGVRLTRFPETEKYTWVPDLKRMVERMSGPRQEGTFLETGVDGVSRLYAFKRLHFQGAPFPHLMIRLGIPVEEALAGARFVMARNLGLLVLTAVLAMFLAWLLSEWTIMRSLRRLVAAADRLGGGDLKTRSGLSHDEAELGLLAKAFDQMAEGLEQREEQRRTAEEEVLRLNRDLEERVEQRTRELAEANQDLREAMDGLRRTQNQLVQSEKMAALGGLVAGVAHEINTPVGIGVTAVSHLGQKTREIRTLYDKDEVRRSDLEDYLAVAQETADMTLGNLERASELIRSFKKVAVDQTTEERRPFKVREYIDAILLSLRPRLKKTRHRVEVRCDPDLMVESYPGAFSQILSNFVLNSLTHAFDEGQEGHMVVEAAASDGLLTLTYSDDGRGMEPEVLQRVFEPFFTTARSKGGSGLGLSIVYNLVTQTLGGTISCESAPGRGATFTVTVPLGREA